MKRKILIYSTLFFSLISFSSCKKNRISILSSSLVSSFIYINYDELKSQLESSYSYLLFIGNNECSSCAISKPLIEKYIESTHQIIYYVDSSNYNKAVEELSLNSYNSSTILLKKGNLTLATIPYSYSNYSSQASINKKISSLVYSSKTLINDLMPYEYKLDSYMQCLNYDSYSHLKKEISKERNYKIGIYPSFSSLNDDEKYVYIDLNQNLSDYIDYTKKENVYYL